MSRRTCATTRDRSCRAASFRAVKWYVTCIPRTGCVLPGCLTPIHSKGTAGRCRTPAASLSVCKPRSRAFVGFAPARHDPRTVQAGSWRGSRPPFAVMPGGSGRWRLRRGSGVSPDQQRRYRPRLLRRILVRTTKAGHQQLLTAQHPRFSCATPSRSSWRTPRSGASRPPGDFSRRAVRSGLSRRGRPAARPDPRPARAHRLRGGSARRRGRRPGGRCRALRGRSVRRGRSTRSAG